MAPRYRAEVDEINGVPVSPKIHRIRPLNEDGSEDVSAEKIIKPPAARSKDRTSLEVSAEPQPPAEAKLGAPAPLRSSLRSPDKPGEQGKSHESHHRTGSVEFKEPAVPQAPPSNRPAGQYKRPSPSDGQLKMSKTRSSIWDDPNGCNTRSVMRRLYKFAEQKMLWAMVDAEEVAHQADTPEEVRNVQIGDLEQLDAEDDTKNKGDDGEEDLIVGDESSTGVVHALSTGGKRTEILRRPSRISVACKNGQVTRIDENLPIEGSPAAAGEPEATSSTAAPPSGANPIKDCLMSKKMDVNEVREHLKKCENVVYWLNTPLDPGPPQGQSFAPCALFHAVARGMPELVSLVLEMKADVSKVYDGKSMYMGSIKPGSTSLQAVRLRKGRFVGTMLGDRLELIEGLLVHAEKVDTEDQAIKEQAKQEGAQDPDKFAEQKRKQKTKNKTKARMQSRVGLDNRRSVLMTSAKGQGGLHTHGHPVDKYDIDVGQKGTVLHGRNRDTFGPVVIKVKSKESATQNETCIWEEISFLRKLAHSCVIKLEETFEDAQHVFLILEHCPGGALFDRLVKDAGNISEPQALNMSRQLINGIVYLHGQQVCHRDIQPCNVLLADMKPLEDVSVRFIDFSTAKDFGEPYPPMKTKVCTPSYVAPEVLAADEVPYTEKVDVWSLGVVIYILLSGMPPFPGMSDVDVLKKVKKANLKFRPPERWSAISDEAKDLMRKMMTKDVEERLSSIRASEHQWLATNKS